MVDLNMMPLFPVWTDIAVLILLTIAAGALIGLNREAGGHAAGFRTTVLVGLAACLLMIQANILLGLSGKAQSSFVGIDVLRFPLGVLTGVGFIGGGAILHRGSLVTGVTTAATLWVMTAIGLVLGGGQLLLGCVGAFAAFLVLSPLKQLDELIPRRHKARLTLILPAQAPVPNLEPLLAPYKCRPCPVGCRMTANGELAISFELRWRSTSRQSRFEELFRALGAAHTVGSFELTSSPA